MAEAKATRAFCAEDQERFARFCGDRNPMHMDPLAARRTQAGAPVVHGMHIALWALDYACAAGAIADVRAVRGHFGRFLRVGETAELVIENAGPDRVRLHIRNGDAPIMTVGVRSKEESGGAHGLASGEPQAIPSLALPLGASAMRGQRGRMVGCANDDPTLFPSLQSVIGEAAVAGLGAMSTLVGMVCPGLHSIFSAFKVDVAGAAGDALDWRVSDFDERVRMVSMLVNGMGVSGSVEAFLRSPPQNGPTIAEISSIVTPTRFGKRKCLVVGGSRGLGAVIAKALAVGGADVSITYASGAADAHALVDEISTAGGTVSAFRLDVEQPLLPQLGHAPANATHLYYCATPHIRAEGVKRFDVREFERYCRYYVSALAELVCWRSSAARGPFVLLYPSSIYVSEPPDGLEEYAAAKAAGERLALDLAATLNYRVSAPRLPRILTDQTATVPPVPAEEPLHVILPVLWGETEHGLGA